MMERIIDGYEIIGIADLDEETESKKMRWITTLEVPDENNEIEEVTTTYEIGMPLEMNPASFPYGTRIVIYKPKVK